MRAYVDTGLANRDSYRHFDARRNLLIDGKIDSWGNFDRDAQRKRDSLRKFACILRATNENIELRAIRVRCGLFPLPDVMLNGAATHGVMISASGVNF